MTTFQITLTALGLIWAGVIVWVYYRLRKMANGTYYDMALHRSLVPIANETSKAKVLTWTWNDNSLGSYEVVIDNPIAEKDMPTRWSIKEYSWSKDNAGSRDYARNCAEELCDKLNER